MKKVVCDNCKIWDYKKDNNNEICDKCGVKMRDYKGEVQLDNTPC